MERHVGGPIEVGPRRHGGKVIGGVVQSRLVNIRRKTKGVEDGLGD